MEEKFCQHCQISHLLTKEWWYFLSRKNGNTQHVCKAQRKRFNKGNAEKIAAKKRAAYESNRDAILARKHKYWEENKEVLRGKRDTYYGENRDSLNERKRRYYQDNSGRFCEQKREYYLENKGRVLVAHREYAKRRRQTDLSFRLSGNLRSRMYYALRGRQKGGSAVRDLGCSIDSLIGYIESMWSLGMSWENWGIGPGKWQIHHIKALALFDLTDLNQVKVACNYTNLKPIWYEDHVKEHDWHELRRPRNGREAAV